MHEWDISFGEAFPLQMLSLTPETKVPGVLIFSPRAALGWLDVGIELAFLKFESAPVARLLRNRCHGQLDFS